MNTTPYTHEFEYHTQFWNKARGKNDNDNILSKGYNRSSGTYAFPDDANGQFQKELQKESLFRSLGTIFTAYRHGYNILTKQSEDVTLL